MGTTDELLWSRWEEVDRCLDAALDLPAAERPALVERVTRQDAELGALLGRLLSHAADASPRLEAPAEPLMAELFPGERVEPDLPPGSTVGRWTIRRQRGRGGMATVYEAARADGAYEQRAALKVLRRGLDTEDIVRRFLTERQILSSLTHPNIARLLDGGSTTDGRPYLVLELVDGEPITAWARSHELDVPQRLTLFLGVADAVHAAHRQLVVHRDIKPSNVMVDGDGRVRLLDFGIARLLEQGSERTMAGSRALTPEYASPEQLRDGPITTASDVYQLGILLHELLTGQRPQSENPRTRPSRLASEAGNQPVARRLRGDIDLVLDKALRSEPEERYASADEFAADVRRHLRGLPIQAHPESTTYRMRKFLGRHPIVLPGSAATAIALAGFMTLLGVQNQRLGAERDAAEAASRRAQETQELFVNLLRSPDPYSPADPERGRAITVAEALRMGAVRVDANPDADPTLRASLLSTIGGVFNSLGQYSDARAVLDRAIALRASTGDTLSTVFSTELGLLSGAIRGQGELDTALVVSERRLRLEREREPADPALLASALTGHSDGIEHADPERAIALQEESVRLLRALGGPELGIALKTLADQYRGAGRDADSEVAAREALAVLEATAGVDHPNTVMARHTLGQTLGERGEFAEATRLLEQSLHVFERDIGVDHPFTLSMRNNLGVAFLNAGDPGRAEEVFRALVPARERTHGERHPEVGSAMQNLAASLLGLGRLAEAEALTGEVEALYREVLPPGSILIAFPMLTRSEIQLARGNFAGARRTIDGIRAALDGRLPNDHPAVIVADCRLGRALAGLGADAQARMMLDGAVARMSSSEGVRDEHRRECIGARAALGAVAPVDSLAG